MKNLFLVTTLSFCAITLWAQVPDSVNQNFMRQYPGVKNQTWKTENDRYRVNYRDSLNMEQSITYNRNGEVYSRYSEVLPGAFPSSVNDYYSKNYPGETKYKVYRETDQMGTNSYYIDRKGERLSFDNQGTFRSKGPMNSNTGTNMKSNSGTNNKSNTGTKSKTTNP